MQPEMTRNVQQQSKAVYLRAQEALHCRVHSTLVLPLYRQVAACVMTCCTINWLQLSVLHHALIAVIPHHSIWQHKGYCLHMHDDHHKTDVAVAGPATQFAALEFLCPCSL